MIVSRVLFAYPAAYQASAFVYVALKRCVALVLNVSIFTFCATEKTAQYFKYE